MAIQCWQCGELIEPLWDHRNEEWYCAACESVIDTDEYPSPAA